MADKLDGKKVAILVADGFEQAELLGPKQALDDAGARTEIVSPKSDEVQGWNHFEKGDTFKVDKVLEEADPSEYDALLLPGGVANPDQLRMNRAAVDFVSYFVQTKKPIAAICHGPWTLIEAHGVANRRMTSWPSLQTDLRNAGAQWLDEEVVVDRGLVTSRKPDDIPAFNEKMLEEFAEGPHQEPTETEAQRGQRQKGTAAGRSKTPSRKKAPGKSIAP